MHSSIQKQELNSDAELDVNKFIDDPLPDKVSSLFNEDQTYQYDLQRDALGEYFLKLLNSKKTDFSIIVAFQKAVQSKIEALKELKQNNIPEKNLDIILDKFVWIVEAVRVVILTYISEKNADLVKFFDVLCGFGLSLLNKYGEGAKKDKNLNKNLNRVLPLLKQFCADDAKFKDTIEKEISKGDSNLLKAMEGAITHYVVEQNVPSPANVFNIYYPNPEKQSDDRNGKLALIEIMRKINAEDKKSVVLNQSPAVAKFFNIVQKIVDTPNDYKLPQEQNYLSSCLIVCKLITQFSNGCQKSRSEEAGSAIMAWVWKQMENDWENISVKDPISLLIQFIAVLVAAKDQLIQCASLFLRDISEALDNLPKFCTIQFNGGFSTSLLCELREAPPSKTLLQLDNQPKPREPNGSLSIVIRPEAISVPVVSCQPVATDDKEDPIPCRGPTPFTPKSYYPRTGDSSTGLWKSRSEKGSNDSIAVAAIAALRAGSRRDSVMSVSTNAVISRRSSVASETPLVVETLPRPFFSGQETVILRKGSVESLRKQFELLSSPPTPTAKR